MPPVIITASIIRREESKTGPLILNGDFIDF